MQPRLSASTSFLLLASMIVSFLAGSSAVTPLYPHYQAQWGFSPITTTAVFGVYAVAVLSALLTFGALSDHVGRRPVLAVTLAMQAATMLLFAGAQSVSTLFAARVLQGLSTGAAVAAIGAGLLDLDRARGTLANAVAPMLGTATGGLVSGLMVRWLPAPTTTVYLFLCGVFVLQGAGVWRMAETASRRNGAWESLRPQPAPARSPSRPMLVAAPLLVAAWALVGFYGSLGPALVRHLSGSTSMLWGGLCVFAFAASGALTVLVLQALPARRLSVLGALSLIGGVALSLLAVAERSTAAFFVASALSGAGFGASFQGAIRSVVPLAAAHERAGVLSVLYVVSYLAMGAPAVIGGVCVVYGGGLDGTAVKYGLAVAALSALGLAGVLAQRRGPVLASAPAPRAAD